MTHEWPYRLTLAVILVGAIAAAALLTRRHGRPGTGIPRSADGRIIATALAAGGLAFYAALLAFLVWPPFLAWSSMGLPSWVRWTGAVMLTGGVGLALWARFTLGRSSTVTAVPAPDAELVTGGPYRWFRHPIYSAFFLVAPGAAALADSWLLLGIGVATWGVLSIRTRREEELLLDRFGEAYRRQMDRTGRWLPRWPPPSPDR